jgi:hypothetical protein
MRAPYVLVSLWEIMFELPIGQLLASFQIVTSHAQSVIYARGNHKGVIYPPEEFAAFLASITSFRECCVPIGLLVTREMAGNVLKCLEAGKVDKGRRVFDGSELSDLDASLQALSAVILHESKTRVALILSADKIGLYEATEPHFGAEVRDKFPTSTYEINEAAKCLALGRTTACVFHLMRATEVTLKAVHACIGADSPRDKNWTNWLTPIREERIRRTTKWAENDFFQDVWQRLDSIKDAQRNRTMHPDSVYTEEEARIIFESTRAFMKKVALRMNEDGEPKA